MSNFTNVVIIDKDPTSIGESATAADLDRYATNLAAHLAEQFPGKIFNVRQEVGARSHCPDDADVNEHVRELVTGDGWTRLVD